MKPASQKQTAAKKVSHKADLGKIAKRSPAVIERARAINRLLAKEFPKPRTPLDYSNEFELLVAVILSAQCTDVRVNAVTPALFQEFPRIENYAAAEPEEIAKWIKSVSYPNNKAKSIVGAARTVLADFGGRIPESMAGLLRIPGVARKTANVMLAELFGRNEGVVVDTHVLRLVKRLKLSNETDPVKVEKDLMPLIQQKDWRAFSLRLVFLGRGAMPARSSPLAKDPVEDVRLSLAAWAAMGRPGNSIRLED